MNFQKNWDLQIDRSVLKFFKKIPGRDTKSLRDVIKFLPHNPYSGDIQKIKGEENTWRKRVGAYRIFFEIKKKEGVILIFNVERRTSNTY